VTAESAPARCLYATSSATTPLSPVLHFFFHTITHNDIFNAEEADLALIIKLLVISTSTASCVMEAVAGVVVGAAALIVLTVLFVIMRRRQKETMKEKMQYLVVGQWVFSSEMKNPYYYPTQ
jgi:NADH:ubiquinone oxidoreductase subunit 6 (subunit J)